MSGYAKLPEHERIGLSDTVDGYSAVPDAPSPSVDVLDLKDKLNGLWEKYLHFLDQYDQAQQQLARHMSSGFFSLAQANFRTTSRTRYGRDYYDERMQASRTTNVTRDTHGKLIVTVAKSQTQCPRTDAAKPDGDHEPHQEKSTQQPTPPSTPQRPSPTDSEPQGPEKTVSTQVKDPLKWFGILIPAQLRQTQKSFSAIFGDGGNGNDTGDGDGKGNSNSAVETAVNAARSMREIEVEISKLRKEIRRAEKASSQSAAI